MTEEPFLRMLNLFLFLKSLCVSKKNEKVFEILNKSINKHENMNQTSLVSVIVFPLLFIVMMVAVVLIVLYVTPTHKPSPSPSPSPPPPPPPPPSPPSPPPPPPFPPVGKPVKLKKYLDILQKNANASSAAMTNFVVLRVGKNQYLAPNSTQTSLTTVEQSAPFPKSMYFVFIAERASSKGKKPWQGFVWGGGDIKLSSASGSVTPTSYNISLTPQAQFFPNWITLDSQCKGKGLWIAPPSSGSSTKPAGLVAPKSGNASFNTTVSCSKIQDIYVIDTGVVPPSGP